MEDLKEAANDLFGIKIRYKCPYTTGPHVHMSTRRRATLDSTFDKITRRATLDEWDYVDEGEVRGPAPTAYIMACSVVWATAQATATAWLWSKTWRVGGPAPALNSVSLPPATLYSCAPEPRAPSPEP